MILHKFTASPFAQLNLQQSMARINSQDKLLLTQDATYALLHQELHSSLAAYAPIYLLDEDMQARGLVIQGDAAQLLFKAITYAEFVELSIECKQVISW